MTIGLLVCLSYKILKSGYDLEQWAEDADYNFEAEQVGAASYDRVIPMQRLLNDWDHSSAGQSGAVFYEHWYLEFHDNLGYKKDSQTRRLSAIPGWCTRKKLSVVEVKEKDTVHLLMDRLVKFDEKAGHPFAWYFYMLHGNRIEK